MTKTAIEKDPRDKYRRYDADLIRYIDAVYCHHSPNNLFSQYILHLQTESDVSERTCQLYIKDLFGTYDPGNNFIRSAEYTFFSYLSWKNIKSYPDITREIIREYIVWLVTHGIAKTSVNRKLSALRSFYEYLLTEKMVEGSPIPVRTHQRNSPRSTLSMKIDKRLPVFLTQPEMDQLINTPDIKRPEGQRDRAMLELLYASGLRVSELWQLNLSNLDLENREIRVIGKGAKERVVLIGLPAVSALKGYLQHGRVELLNQQHSEALFVNKYGRRLSIRGIQKILKHYASVIGLEKNVHPHVLRHTFATHMLDGGADLRVVQELLGHADLSTTQIYTHITRQQARKVYLNAHPMAREKDNDNANQT